MHNPTSARRLRALAGLSRYRRFHHIFSLGSIFWLSLLAEPSSAQQSKAPAYVYAPRVLHYDIETDRFTHQSSVFTPPPAPRAGDDVRYYGNRLTKFRFVGPPRQAGIYASIELYQRRRKRDPRNYHYHW